MGSDLRSNGYRDILSRSVFFEILSQHIWPTWACKLGLVKSDKLIKHFILFESINQTLIPSNVGWFSGCFSTILPSLEKRCEYLKRHVIFNIHQYIIWFSPRNGTFQSAVKYQTKTLNVTIRLQQFHLPAPPPSLSPGTTAGKDLTSVSGQCALFLSK